MARDRSDLRWQHLAAKEQWRERLRWARESHGSYPQGEAFAAAVSESGPNYRKYERLPSDGKNYAKDLPYAKAVKWADVLDVRWKWLLDGEGVPWRDDEDETTPVARISRLLAGEPAEDQERIAAMLEVMLKKKVG